VRSNLERHEARVISQAVERKQHQEARVISQATPVVATPTVPELLLTGRHHSSISSGCSSISEEAVDNCQPAPAACRSRSASLGMREAGPTTQRRACSASRRSNIHTVSSRSKSASAPARRAPSVSRRPRSNTSPSCENDISDGSKQLEALGEDNVLASTLFACSAGLRLERQRFEKGQEDNQQWLQKVLNEQINDIETHWKSVCNQNADDVKREALMTQQRERAERALQAKKDRDDARRESAAESEKRITSQRREKFAERNRLLDEKMDAVSAEKKRLHDLRKASEMEHIAALKAMKEEIKQFRESADLNSSNLNLAALRNRVDNVCGDLRQ